VVNSCGEVETETQLQEYDAVVVATGYTRNIHEDILAPSRTLMAGGDKPENKWTVSRDYKVNFEEGMVSEDAGIYLQGCNEESHGVSSILLIWVLMLTYFPACRYALKHSRHSRR
jgi:L-ornithine N5-oxygenase